MDLNFLITLIVAVWVLVAVVRRRWSGPLPTTYFARAILDNEDEDEVPSPKLATLVQALIPKAHAATEGTTAWITDLLSHSIHVLVIGGTGGGKTTLLQRFATILQGWGQSVVVMDPDAAAGDWPGCTVLGAGDDFEAIDKGFTWLAHLAGERRKARAAGQREFPALYVLLDEYADIKDECKQAGSVVENMLRRARKLNIHLYIGVQDKQVRTLGFERKSHLLHNTRTVKVEVDPQGRRTATIDDAGTFNVPVFPSPNGIGQSAAQFLRQNTDPDTDTETVFSGINAENSGIGEDNGIGLNTDGDTDLSPRDLAILAILQTNPGASKSGIFAAIGGNRNDVFRRVGELQGELVESTS